MERSDNEIIYPWSNVNEYRDRDSIDTMRILFLRSSSLLLRFSSRFSISFSFSLILFNSLVPSPLTPLFYSFPSLFTPASSTSSNWTLSSPFSQCGPRSASFDTYSHTFFHAHTHTTRACARAHICSKIDVTRRGESGKYIDTRTSTPDVHWLGSYLCAPVSLSRHAHHWANIRLTKQGKPPTPPLPSRYTRIHVPCAVLISRCDASYT